VKKVSTKSVRCAICTRVSTDHGLEQNFNSLDAQHDAAQAYIRSQTHAGWTLIQSWYDDGGYSGGSIDRSTLQRLLADLEAGRSMSLSRLQGRPPDPLAGELRQAGRCSMAMACPSSRSGSGGEPAGAEFAWLHQRSYDQRVAHCEINAVNTDRSSSD
jgi:hypothetical protein